MLVFFLGFEYNFWYYIHKLSWSFITFEPLFEFLQLILLKMCFNSFCLLDPETVF